MKKAEFINKASRAFHKTGLKLKKHSPEMLMAAGIVGVVTGTVMACKATVKATAVVEEHNKKMEIIHKSAEDGQTVSEEGIVPYSEEDAKHDTTIVFKDTAIDFIKLYGPAIAVTTVSVGCLVASNRILNKRNVALAAAYKAVDDGFKKYRSNVVERFGENVDHELKYNIKAKQIEERVVDENGNESVVTKTVYEPSTKQYDALTRCFDENTLNWVKNADLNKKFLLDMQAYFNRMLKKDGYVFLNDVYKALGFQRVPEGQELGWIYDPKNENKIDFGIFDIHKETNRLFVNGYERSIWVNFNVDGPIKNMI